MKNIKFQDLSGIPLRRIVDFLDVNSCKNLLEATKQTEMGLELVNMSREKEYACPVCLIDKFNDNAVEIFQQQPRVETERRMIQMDYFAFFFQFIVSQRGTNNYGHTITCIDEFDTPISELHRTGRNHDVYFTGCFEYKAPSDNWLAMIEEIRKKQCGKNSVFVHELRRMHRMLFGGSYDGITIHSTLKLYTRRELEQHICRGHNLDDSNDLNLREFWIWTSEWGGPRTFKIPTMWYNQHREINLQSMNEIIQRFATAKYYNYKRRSEENNFARRLLSKELHIMLEALDIFRFGYDSFSQLRFPVQFGPWHELRLINYYDMIRLTLEALLE